MVNEIFQTVSIKKKTMNTLTFFSSPIIHKQKLVGLTRSINYKIIYERQPLAQMAIFIITGHCELNFKSKK